MFFNTYAEQVHFIEAMYNIKKSNDTVIIQSYIVSIRYTQSLLLADYKNCSLKLKRNKNVNIKGEYFQTYEITAERGLNNNRL